ncbi:MAG: hypothetical protein J7515_01520 [Caulobacter sp.]|nr:hypothetical protein [Caulobacter sp.]
MPFSGQLWYMTEGGDADTRLVRVNDDGTGQTTVVSNGAPGPGDDRFISSFTADLGVDTAAGFYFAILSNEINDHAYLVRGSIDGSAGPTTVIDFADDLIVNTIEVDAINHKIYVGVQDGNGTNGAVTGIKVYSYDAAGNLTDNGYITTANTDNRPDLFGFKVLDPQDFAIDRTSVAGGRLFYSERVDDLTYGLFRIDLSNPNVATNMLANGLFPADGSNGQIIDLEVDESTDLVYFTTRSLHPSGTPGYDANDNAIWYISETASGGTPTKVTLTGMPANVFYGGDMTFDQSTRQIYVESGETDVNSTDDVIYVFQLDASGTSASLIRTISAGLTQNGAQIEGLTFADLAALSVTGSGASATEQGTQVTLLSGAPTITDNDGGYLTGATVQITGGAFTSNENSIADDHLGYGASKQISGTIAGTSITLSWNAATETLTLSGYDTIANYQAALAGLVYWATGDNPTNYGANTTRTLTWTINDGTPGVAPGSVNSSVSTVNIAAVNDAPVNSASVTASGNEDSDIAVTGLQISDVDANPASATMTVALSVTHGVLTLRTDVAGGLTAGDISGNGAGSVTVTGTINAINATLAASNGLVFHGDQDVSGTDTLTVVTSDGGDGGSGGALSDTDSYTITINPTQDPHTGGVSIAGVATEDQVLTADTSTLADADDLGALHYQWQRDAGSGFVNVGADQATYTLGDADVGTVIRVIASYTDGLGAVETATSAATGAVAAVDDAPTGGVTIAGTTTEDQILTADTSTLADVDGLGALHYQWQRNSGSGFVNVGTDQATYTLGDADVGTVVRVVASYTDGQGFTDAVTSAATAPIANVNDAPTGGASINGTATQNQTLTADTSTLADADGLGVLHYQWQRDTGSGFVNVGTDQATYTLGAADVGGVVRVTASYVDGHGTAEAVTSAATAPVASSGPPNLHLVGTPGFDFLVGGLGNDVIEGLGFTDILVGGGGSDTFVFGAHPTGVDLITDFGGDDVILTKSKLYDGNNDGIVPTHAGLLDLGGLDAVFLGAGHDGVRYLGVTADGFYAYGDADTRPKKAIEGKLSNDTLTGDVGDHKSNVFFFDTDLSLNWGADHITRFGAKDVLVTTTALADPNHDNLILAGPGSIFGFTPPSNSPAGTVNGSTTITNTAGVAVSTLEFDGVISHDGVDYYVYSLVGSSGGTGSVLF